MLKKKKLLPCIINSFALMFTQDWCKYLSNTFTWPRVNVLGHASVNLYTIYL
jgi:hypothetical protein